MTFKSLKTQFLLICSIGLLTSSCNIPFLATNKLLISSNAVMIPYQSPFNSFVDDNGNGIIISEGKSKSIKNYLPTGNDVEITDNLGNSFIGLNKNGDGLIVWSPSPEREVSAGKPSPPRFYYNKIKNYQAIKGSLPLGEGITIISTKIDDKGNGIILWDSRGNLNYKEIKDFVISDKILDYKKTNDKSFLYISPDNTGLIKEFPVNDNVELKELKFNDFGDGFYSYKENNSYYLKLVNKYQMTGKKIDMGDSMSFSSSQISLNQNGNGFIIGQEFKPLGNGSIYKQQINNYILSKEKQALISNSEYKSFPTLFLNNIGKGYMLWVETKDAKNNLYMDSVDNYSIK